MSRSSGDHLKWNEVKEGIIEFVASRSEAVPEPDIRTHLAEKYGITDLKNIKKHLSDLQRQPNSCIEKIRPKPGFANRWEIRRIEHVKNIGLQFPEIQLKMYEKPLTVVVKRFSSHHPGPFMANKFRTQLLISNSFFDTCVKTDPEIVYDRAYELYRHSFDKWRNKYPEWKQRFLEDMAQGIAINMFPIIKEVPIGMSRVVDLIEWALEREAKKKKDEKSELMCYLYQLNQLGELFEMKKGEESESMRYWNQLSKLGELFETKKDEEPELMYYWNEWDKSNLIYLNDLDKSGEPSEMKFPYLNPVLNETMFELCFQIDVKDGTVSPEEIDFVNETKKLHAHFKANPKICVFSELKACDDFYVRCFEKFKAKTRIPQT